MSRVGRLPIAIPNGVNVKIDGSRIVVEKGKVAIQNPLPDGITCALKDNVATFARRNDTRQLRALHGLTRALVANAVKGVSEGFKRDLEIIGIGYRAQVQGSDLQLALGFSHPVVYAIPEGIEVKVEKQTRLTVSGPIARRSGRWLRTFAGCGPRSPIRGRGSATAVR
jgi:large subunit ribosomal protein L6